MKKLYTLSLVLFGMVSGFAQVIFSENMGTPSGNTLITAYVTGTAPATFQNVATHGFSGTADVRTSQASSGYTGASGSGNVFFTSSGGGNKTFQIDGINTSAYASAGLELSFGYITSQTTVQMIVEVSTNGTDWTALSFSNNANTSWNLVTIGGGVIPSSSTLSVRFTGPPATSGMRIDDVVIRNGANACSLVLGATTATCDAATAGTDTYTATIAFTGGGNGTYNVIASSGTIGGDSPSTSAAGTITISGVQEGTALTVTVTGNDCNLASNIASPSCVPPAEGVTLPYTNNFEYPEAAVLGAQANWENVNTGDDIVVMGGNLNYTGLAAIGNSITFAGSGIDNFLGFNDVNSSTVYYSFLINVNSMAGVTDANGGYFAGLASSTSNFGATLWTKRIDDENFYFGTEVRTANAANTTWTSESYEAGQTYLVVVGYTFGSEAADDTVALWINPTVGAGQPAATITDTHTGTDLSTINKFFFRQDSAGETPSVQIDALRIGTTWADVTSSNLSVNDNNIAGLKMYPNPVNNGRLFIESAANAEKQVAVYDVLGKQVLNANTVSSEVNVSALKSGVYIVKITEEGKTATRKLVIR